MLVRSSIIIFARLNENFPLPGVQALRKLGHDVLTVAEAGKVQQAIPDNQVLAFATEANRAVVTINRKHFIRLHRDHPEHAGILVCTLDADFAGQAERIDAVIKSQGELKGQLLRVNRPS